MGSRGALFGKAFGKQPKGPNMPQIDPAQLIALQDRTNRVNTSTPFGSQTYGTDASGRTTFNTTLSPQMQALVDRGMGLAGRDMQRYQAPEGMEGLIQALMSRVGNRAGSKP